MKIHQSTVILLLVVCAPLSSYGQNFKDFKNKHLAPAGMKIGDCTDTILGRGINHGAYCKAINTFTKPTENEIANLCTNANIYSGKQFNVIEYTSLNNTPSCNYSGRSRKNHTLTVTCKNNLPVHYGKPKITNG